MVNEKKSIWLLSHISNGVDSVNGYLSQMVSGNGRTLPVSNGKTVTNKYKRDIIILIIIIYINICSNNIISTPTIGTPTYVNPKKDNNYYLANNTNTPTNNNNINLNANGSIKPIGDNSVGNIDINTLLKDSNFINELKSILP